MRLWLCLIPDSWRRLYSRGRDPGFWERTPGGSGRSVTQLDEGPLTGQRLSSLCWPRAQDTHACERCPGRWPGHWASGRSTLGRFPVTVRGPRAARPGPAGPWPVCRDREGSDSTGQVRVLAASEHEGRLSRGQASGPHGLHQQIRGRPWQSLAGAVVPSSPQGSEQPHRAPSRTGLKDTVPGDGALAVLSWQTSL